MGRWVASVMIAVLFLASVLLVHLVGSRSRISGSAATVAGGGSAVEVVDTPRDVYTLWKRKGFQGRIIVHISNYLRFVPVEEESVYRRVSAYPVDTVDFREAYEQRLDNRNLLWVAMKGNIGRLIHAILPPTVFEEKRNALGDGPRGITVQDDAILVHYLGLPRTIRKDITPIQEPVLLNIDASYLEWEDARGLVERIRAAGLEADLVTLCLETETPEVSDGARQRLRQLASLLRES